MSKRICRTCREEKEESSFYRAKTSGYYDLDCRDCSSKKKQKYYEEHRGIIQEQRKKKYYKSLGLSRKKNRESYYRHVDKRLAYHKKRIEIWNRKLHQYFGEKCFICHCNENCFSLYECHHVNPETKKYIVARMSSKDWELEVVPELEKCIYLCVVCHRKLHANRFEEKIRTGEIVLTPGRRNIE
jgi:hypothetical protein